MSRVYNTIVQDVARELRIPVPTAVEGSTDYNVAQIARMVAKECRELARGFDWQFLVKEQTFSALNQETQTGMVPTDFLRFVPDTFYNRTRKRALVGPLTPQEWQVNKSLTATVVVDAFRQRGDDILVIPSPTAGDTFAFEYVSKFFVSLDGGDTYTSDTFTDDSDVVAFDGELVRLGAIWRFKQSSGLDYAEDFRSYQICLATLRGDDGGKRIMDLRYPSRLRRAVAPQVQEGSWDLS